MLHYVISTPFIFLEAFSFYRNYQCCREHPGTQLSMHELLSTLGEAM